MVFRRLLALSLTPLLAFLGGCTDTPSENIKTQGFWASFTATANNDSAISTRAYFKSGGALSNTYITLSGSDYLDAANGGVTQIMTKDGTMAFGETEYITTFSNLAKSSGETVTFTLHRDGEMIKSYVVLPNTFIITAPSANTIYHIGTNDTVTLTWSPANGTDAMSFDYYYTCTTGGNSYTESRRYASNGDAGAESITVKSILDPLLQRTPPVALADISSCNATITVTRKRSQNVPSIYDGGNAYGEQVRSLAVSFVQ